MTNKCTLLRKKLLFYAIFAINILAAQKQNTEDFTLKTKLSIKHRIELMTYKQKLDTVTNPISQASIYNDIVRVYMQASYYLSMPKYDSIHYYANQAVLLTKNNPTKIARLQYLLALNNIGSSYKDLGYKSKALEYFSKTLRLTQNIINPSKFYEHRQFATSKIAFIHADQQNFELAIKQYESLLRYVDRNHIDKEKMSSIVYMKLASFYRKIDSLDIAVGYANHSIVVANRNKKPHRIAMGYLELASIKLEGKEYDLVESFLSKAFDILKQSDYISLLSKYYKIKSILADRSDNSTQKVYYAEKAFELLQNGISSLDHVATGKILSEAYKDIGEFEKALELLERVVGIEKNILNNDEINKSNLLEIERRDNRIAFEQKQKEVERVKGNRKNIIIIVTLLFFLMAAVTTFYIFKDRQKEIRLAAVIKQKNDQLEDLDLAKSRFFANISHELRTPLTLISGPIEQVLNEEKQLLNVSVKSKLNMVLNNTNSLATLIDDILDLSKLKVNKLVLNHESVKLEKFLKEIADNFIVLAERSDIKFDVKFERLKDRYVLIDVSKTEKIINNLISNAFKYTPSKGCISLLAEDNGSLQVIVRDTGSGISNEDIPKIFDRYFQSSDHTKPLIGGSGIGLSLVKELVHLMKGEITVESALGQGSMFRLTIPIIEAGLEYEEYTEELDETLGETISLDHLQLDAIYDKKVHTILIVEDHEGMQHFITSILEKRYQLILASNGEEAIQKLSNNTIDLIISDIMMPVMDGYTLLETIKNSDMNYDIPMIMLTALSGKSHKLKALAIGADDYLTKPFLAEELLARVHNLIERYDDRKQLKVAIVTDDGLVIGETQEEEVIANDTNVFHNRVDKELIEKVASIIETNMEDPDFVLMDLTKELHLGERQLRRKIKLVTGLSPKKFQQEILLQKARELMENETYPSVKAVALSVGMCNVTRFGKLYEARYGKHPAAYFRM